MAEAYIVAATRTAGGRKGGRLREWHSADLAGAVLDELIARTGIDPNRVDDVLMGCVTQAGEQSSNIARNAILASSLPERVPGVSLDRQCGSSQQAMHFAAQAVMSGTMDVVIAAGVENMSRSPMGMAAMMPMKAGFGGPMSPKIHARYPDVQEFSQFVGAELIAAKHNQTKDQLDRFGFESHQRAIAATQAGAFKDEILVLEGKDAEGNVVAHDSDEGIRYNVSLEGMQGVKLLQEGGRLTAATSSQICDGASGVMIVSEKALKELGLTPIGRIHHMTVIGGDPIFMLETPLPATELALKRAGMKIDDIDLYEVNEAFASVPMAWLGAIGADPAKLNVNGGAIALGHPLGASGTKLMTTMLHALKARGGRYGLQTMCEGGGLANVTIVERLN